MDAPRRWVHLYEEDTAEGAMYAPEEAGVPLARRPRGRIVLFPDGEAEVSVGGPDDRPVATSGRWARAGDRITIRLAEGGRVLHVRTLSPERWIVTDAR